MYVYSNESGVIVEVFLCSDTCWMIRLTEPGKPVKLTHMKSREGIWNRFRKIKEQYPDLAALSADEMVAQGYREMCRVFKEPTYTAHPGGNTLTPAQYNAERIERNNLCWYGPKGKPPEPKLAKILAFPGVQIQEVAGDA